MTDTAKRNQLSTAVGLTIPPPRVRTHFDKKIMNLDVEEKLEPIREKLLTLKKVGAPEVRAKPEKPEKDDDGNVDEAAAEDYKEAMAEYKEQQKAFNSYSSDEFERLSTIYDLCKKLKKISALFDKQAELATDGKKLTQKNLKELAKEQAAVLDVKPDNWKSKKEFVPVGFAEFTNGVDVQHPAEVNALLSRLLEENEQVSLFFERDTVSKSKIRFTDSSIIALADALQMTIEEFAEHAMDMTLEANKKIMHPDHLVSPGLEDCAFYPFFAPLPSFKRIVDRQRRKAQWNQDYKDFKAKNSKKKSKTTRAKVKKGTTPTKPEFTSWEQREVDDGFAISYDTTDDKGKKKTHYLWKGIDDLSDADGEYDEPDRKFNFTFYIGQVCKQLKDINKEEYEDYESIRVSTNIKRFLSNLIIEFIHRIAPRIRILMHFKDAKTVSYEMIVTVLKSILVDSYVPGPNGHVELSETHQDLFNSMEERVRKYTEYHKSGKKKAAKEETEANDDDADDDDADTADEPTITEVEDDEDHDDTEPGSEPEPEPEPAKTKNRRQRTKGRRRTRK